MPSKPAPKLSIKINILKHQGNPEKFYIRLISWALSTGRYIIILVEIVVLAAFLSRFKFDSDFADTKEKIDQHIPFIKSRAVDELIIRQTQLQLATIKDIRLNSINYNNVLRSIANQTPSGVKISSLHIEKKEGTVGLKITAEAKTNSDIINFVGGLKSDNNFSGVALESIGLDKTLISFSVSATVNHISSQNQQL